jgi:hypothetical protein
MTPQIAAQRAMEIVNKHGFVALGAKVEFEVSTQFPSMLPWSISVEIKPVRKNGPRDRIYMAGPDLAQIIADLPDECENALEVRRLDAERAARRRAQKRRAA